MHPSIAALALATHPRVRTLNSVVPPRDAGRGFHHIRRSIERDSNDRSFIHRGPYGASSSSGAGSMPVKCAAAATVARVTAVMKSKSSVAIVSLGW